MVCSWKISWRQCVINKPTTVELCISPVYRRLAVAKFFEVHNVEIAHVTLTTPTQGTLTHHKTKSSYGRPVEIFIVRKLESLGFV